jgi:hypothetical protein
VGTNPSPWVGRCTPNASLAKIAITAVATTMIVRFTGASAASSAVGGIGVVERSRHPTTAKGGLQLTTYLCKDMFAECPKMPLSLMSQLYAP